MSAITLAKVIRKNVETPTATLHTDASPSYFDIGMTMAGHHSVNHSAGQYTTEKSHGTNLLENYFGQLKRSLDGTHHHVSTKHLNRYLGEFDFRHSTRKVTDTERMGMLVDRSAGIRVSYKRVKGAGL